MNPVKWMVWLGLVSVPLFSGCSCTDKDTTNVFPPTGGNSEQVVPPSPPPCLKHCHGEAHDD